MLTRWIPIGFQLPNQRCTPFAPIDPAYNDVTD
jgi:hypothetical protein